MDTKILTPEVVVAYSQCPLKAYLLLRSEDRGTPNEYVYLLEEQARRNRLKYRHRIEREHPTVSAGNVAALLGGEDVLRDIPLRLHDLAADCDVLTKVNRGSSLGSHSYEPLIVVGTCQVNKEQKLAILFIGYLLGQLQNQLPAVGTIVNLDGQAHRVAPVSFKLELQALALRTGKTYIQELPTILRREVELFIDFEGIPGQDFHYLIGLLINEQGNRSYHAFWANALEKINAHPEAPVYHYGSYEPRAIDGLAQKYQTTCEALKGRLVNLNASIYGKVYFPSRSNNLNRSWEGLSAPPGPLLMRLGSKVWFGDIVGKRPEKASTERRC